MDTQAGDRLNMVRRLTQEEIEKLKNDNLISDFYRNKLEKDAKKNWDLFYKRNQDKFFKDRHWTLEEFQELLQPRQNEDYGSKKLLEIGCGVGNFVFPLLEAQCNYFIYACDFSPVAIDILKKNSLYNESKIKAFVADVTDEEKFLTQFLNYDSLESIDLVTLIYVLSTITPEKMQNVINNLYKVNTVTSNNY